jgi:hypothetical protein
MGRVQGTSDGRVSPPLGRQWWSAAERWFVGGLVVAAALGAIVVATRVPATSGEIPEGNGEQVRPSREHGELDEEHLDLLADQNRTLESSALYVFLVDPAEVQSLDAALESERVVREMAGEAPRRHAVVAAGSDEARAWTDEAQQVHGPGVRVVDLTAVGLGGPP